MHKETKVKWRLLLQCVFWSFQQIWNNISKWKVSFLTELLYFGTAAPFFSYYTVNKVEWRAALTQASTRLLTTVPASVDALGICRLFGGVARQQQNAKKRAASYMKTGNWSSEFLHNSWFIQASSTSSYERVQVCGRGSAWRECVCF